MIIFVAGVHGVGKTYLATPTAKQLGIKHATASQLIKEERGTKSWSENKRVDEVHDNQTALISALKKLQEKGESLLLDGHFVLRDETSIPITIDIEVFKALQIDAVILLEGDADTISERLSARGDQSWTSENLCSFASSELAHAIFVTSSLGLPIKRMTTPNHAQFINVVKSFLENT